METILKEAGSDLEHILKVNIYLANLQRDFADMNEAYLEVSHLSSSPQLDFCILRLDSSSKSL